MVVCKVRRLSPSPSPTLTLTPTPTLTQVHMWDLQTKQLLQTLEGHSDVVLGISCHPKRDMVCAPNPDLDLNPDPNPDTNPKPKPKPKPPTPTPTLTLPGGFRRARPRPTQHPHLGDARWRRCRCRCCCRCRCRECRGRVSCDLDQIWIRSGSDLDLGDAVSRVSCAGARGEVHEVPDPCTRAPAPKLYARACRACVRSVCAVCAFVCVCVCRA